jgi:hypothetical protein
MQWEIRKKFKRTKERKQKERKNKEGRKERKKERENERKRKRNLAYKQIEWIVLQSKKRKKMRKCDKREIKYVWCNKSCYKDLIWWKSKLNTKNCIFSNSQTNIKYTNNTENYLVYITVVNITEQHALFEDDFLTLCRMSHYKEI